MVDRWLMKAASSGAEAVAASVAANLPPPNMALQRTRAARFARIGSPLNARPLGTRGSYQTVPLATNASRPWRTHQTASVALDRGGA